MTLALAPNEAHIWLVNPQTITDDDVLQGYFPLMNEAESAQQQRFLRPIDRHRYLVTRALARTTLSRYMDRAPASWKFTFNKWGRPEIDPDQLEIPLRFNISHTNELIAILVNLQHDAGIDVEDLSRRVGVMSIADFSFAPGESQDLQSLEGETQKQRFFLYWTLKEAYIKARGMGLAIPLSQFSFHRSGGDTLYIDFDEDFGDQARRWQFQCFAPTDKHWMSVAFQGEPTPDYKIRVFWTVPMQSEEEENLEPVMETKR